MSKSGFAVVDNLGVALAAVEDLVEGADEVERPGLERASREIARIIASSLDPRVQWAQRILAGAGVDAGDMVAAVRALRSHASGLGILEAGVLVRRLNEAGSAVQAAGRRRPGPRPGPGPSAEGGVDGRPVS
ncbi:hypothetical protein [Actinacidiphila yeochonensis]|uniref:hypothetical protein n=1 Tax=Actinacidiphila yeochonensis TaxID=89050 RepID=UPI000567FD56|nr:hypothetical protein [Actinacidiphila yeochonensis]